MSSCEYLRQSTFGAGIKSTIRLSASAFTAVLIWNIHAYRCMTPALISNHSKRMAIGHGPPAQVFLVRNSATVSREIAGETLVVPICAGIGDMEAVYSFNGLGGQLWRLLEESQAEDDLIAWVTRNYQVGRDVAVSDIQNFLADLKEVGLVKQVVGGNKAETCKSSDFVPVSQAASEEQQC
jgi:hypothetical protein